MWKSRHSFFYKVTRKLNVLSIKWELTFFMRAAAFLQALILFLLILTPLTLVSVAALLSHITRMARPEFANLSFAINDRIALDPGNEDNWVAHLLFAP